MGLFLFAPSGRVVDQRVSVSYFMFMHGPVTFASNGHVGNQRFRLSYFMFMHGLVPVHRTAVSAASIFV